MKSIWRPRWAGEGCAVEAVEGRGGEQTQRLFVGRTRGKSSAVILADDSGNPRIIMSVTPGGKASLDFIDDKGDVIQSLPGAPVVKK